MKSTRRQRIFRRAPDVEIALYEAAHGYKDGVPDLAKDMGTNPGTLNNKVDPAMPDHVINIREFRAISRLTENYAPLHALCADLGHIAIPRGDYTATSDNALLDLALRMQKEFGELAAVILSSYADDGRIDGGEMRRIRKESRDLDQVKAELMERLEFLAADDEEAA